MRALVFSIYVRPFGSFFWIRSKNDRESRSCTKPLPSRFHILEHNFNRPLPSSPSFTILSRPQPPPAGHTHPRPSRRPSPLPCTNMSHPSEPAALPLGSHGRTTASRLVSSGAAGNTGSRTHFYCRLSCLVSPAWGP